MEKIKLPKEVAEAIDYLRSVHQENVDILSGVLGNANTDLYLKLRKYTQTNFDTFLQALVNDYEAGQTPEEKVRDMYELHFDDGERSPYETGYNEGVQFGVKQTLDILGLKIDGVYT